MIIDHISSLMYHSSSNAYHESFITIAIIITMTMAMTMTMTIKTMTITITMTISYTSYTIYQT